MALAGNLLVNPSFELNSGHTIPSGWTRFAPPTAEPFGNYWVEGNVPPQSGSLYFKEWGACNNNVTNAAGIYQDFGAVAGNTYQASGYFFTATNDTLGANCYVWLEVLFLGSSSNLLALYQSSHFNANVGAGAWFQFPVTNACNISAPVAIGDPYFNTYAVTGSVSQVVAPAGTKTVRYRFVYVGDGNAGHGSCYLDSTVLNQTSGSIPPIITSLFPDNLIFINPGDGLSFTANSPSGYTIANNNISLVLNGVDVSSSLSISGSSSNKTVAYSGLQSNTAYNATISVTDSSNLTSTANTYFETTWVGIQPVLYLWEAEDFDFNSGHFYDHPTFCTASGTTNCYFGTVGVPTIDEFASTFNPTALLYRASPEAIGTTISGDYNRKDHYLAGVFDYRVDPFDGGMWLNYTRDFTNGTYWVVGRLSTDVGAAGTLTLSKVVGATTNVLGTFKITSGQGWTSFQNVYLQDTNGVNALVSLTNKQTLNLTANVGNILLNFFALVVAQPDLPTLSNVYPTGSHPFEYTNTFGFTTTTTGSSFPANSIRVILDGFDVTSNLVITGSTSTKNVVFTNLLPNAIHTVVFTVTNALGHGILVSNTFDTFSEANAMYEAEDFDYNGGQHFDDGVPNDYGGTGGTTNIDYQHSTLTSAECCFSYRLQGLPQDRLNPPGFHYDYVRSNFVYYGGIDYIVQFFNGGEWGNYTHVYPTGSYYVYLRTSGGGPFSLYLDQVTSGAGTPTQSTRRLGTFAGTFSGIGTDYHHYGWFQLLDNTETVPAVVTLNGLTTLRLTTGGNCNPNFFMLVPVSGISMTARHTGNNVVVSFPSQLGVNYRLFYRTNLTAGSWTLLTTVPGNGGVTSVTNPAVGVRFYKVFAP
jgi:hypothetical protein